MARHKRTDDDDSQDEAPDVKGALERVLDHAESHGEAYEGATDDHATLREYLDTL